MSWAQVKREQARKKLRLIDSGKLLQRTDPLATAHHEAAHAVFSEGFGRPVIWATCYPLIEDGQKLLGYVHGQEEMLLNGVLATMQMLAGDIAEHPLIFGREYKMDDAIMSGSDGEELREIWTACHLLDASNDKKIAFLQHATEQAADLVRKTERWITPVAIEMYAHKRIEGDEIRNILRGTGFYTPQNPLCQFYFEAKIIRIVGIAEINKIPLPPADDEKGVSTPALMKWFQDNGPVLLPLLLDENADWNQKKFGESYQQKEKASGAEIWELALGFNTLKTFGVRIPGTEIEEIPASA